MDMGIQDFYADEFSHCFGCGKSNPKGLQLKSYWDGDDTIARYLPSPEYSGGVPNHVYGGFIACLMDCHGAATAIAYTHRANGCTMGESDENIRYVTASLKVDFIRPTPMGVELTVKGKLLSMEGRKVRVDLTLSANGEVCAKGEMLAVRFKE